MTQLTTELKPAPRSNKPPAPSDRMTGQVVFGLLVVVLMFGGIAGWTIGTSIEGAVVAPGMVAVESNRKTVQHLEGGIVGEIYVQEGDYAQAGQLLMRLDDTLTQANLSIVVNQQNDFLAQRARLTAELTGRESIVYPTQLLDRSAESEVAEMIVAQDQLFTARREARAAEAASVQQRIAAFSEQIKGLKQQGSAVTKELKLSRDELEVLEGLLRKELVPVTRVLELRRSLARLEGQRAGGRAQIASLKAQIHEAEAQIARADKDFREQVSRDLTTVQAQLYTVTEQRAAAEDRLERGAIRAPQAGRILDLRVHTRGGVITAGDPIMNIIPSEDELVLMAQIPPADVDRVSTGLDATIRLTAFNQDTTPEITGKVQTISADSVYDEVKQTSFFRTQISISKAELSKIGGLQLVPGMPAEILIKTGERQVISYLIKPLLDSFARTFRDE
ncbi:HlyD family type I secretion periplasmic adaptor subunit [Denitrobaculum tricleocarpae]|uniref:Membrane fusion protein (MFP) family protein n=1 Tax=Denitrobaculum tricleocarpae TaxID=2591009 RepID=A0A545T7Y2_9PROT|nr:HlyD family type I secretion periplasmic adaptor subunit [Denitrobaculum tricleocarpae]TQV73275.1 HlyD family type I secretion periplasmic adaptor subunit [Denitrobaculum tricleocarpae]